MVGDVQVDSAIARFDIPWMLGVTLLLLFLMLPPARSRITRWEGGLMIVVYLLYIYLIF
jgi:Ca2+/Na+ antiporter